MPLYRNDFYNLRYCEYGEGIHFYPMAKAVGSGKPIFCQIIHSIHPFVHMLDVNMPNLIKRDLFLVSYIMQEAFDECHLIIM